MSRYTILAAVAVAAFALTPAALAGWGSYGGSEPDTKFDRNGGFMYTDAPGSATSQVYFNGFPAEGAGGALAVNDPTLGSRILPVGEGAYRALLGVWRDCNHDGFIGMADGALLEYRAEASAAAGHLVDLTLCPSLPDTAANQGNVFNDGGWITELIPLAPATSPSGTDNTQAAANATNYRILFGTTVSIWADKDSKPETPSHYAAPTDHCSAATLTPLTDGYKASHTGGVIQQVVCDESRQGPTPNDLYDTANGIDPTGVVSKLPRPSTLYQDNGPLDLPYPGTEQACANPGTQPCQSNAFVSNEFDCSKGSTTRQHVADPTGGSVGDTYLNVTTYAPGTPHFNPKGTGPATANETISETPQVETTGTSGDAVENAYLGGSGNEKCNTQSQSSNWIYAYPISTGGSPADVLAGNKQKADMIFTWDGPQSRARCDTTTAWQQVSRNKDPVPNDPAVVPGVRCGEPNNKGMDQTNAALTDDGWFDGVNWVNMHPAVGTPTADRTTTPATVTLDTTPAYYVSFYAQVVAPGISLPGGLGTYGTEFCPSGTGVGAPNLYGWDCNPAEWNIDAGTHIQSPTAPKVGDAYNLRDVDCYDTTVVSGGSSVNPTHQDIGGRTVAAANNPTSACQ